MTTPLKFGDVEWISWDEFADMHGDLTPDALDLWRELPAGSRSALDECEIGVRRDNGAPVMLRCGTIPEADPCEECGGIGEVACDDCDTAGAIECDRGFDHDCPTCDGKGAMACADCS